MNIWEIAYGTNRGRKRKANEDGITVFKTMHWKHQNRPSYCQLLALADGMGGHEKGELASSIALGVLSTVLMSKWHETPLTSEEELINALRQAFLIANEAVVLRAEEEEGKMGSTLVTFVNVSTKSENFSVVGNVGDSRCYLTDNSKLRQITRDDSEVQNMIDNDEITHEEARSHPLRNKITNAIGIFPNDSFTPSISPVDVSAATRVLLCSDGLYSVVSDSEIFNVLKKEKPDSKAVKKLVKMANERGGPDNVSLIVGQIR